MRYINCKVLDAADDVSRTSGKIDANQLISASFVIRLTDSTGAGTVKIQASNDICDAQYLPAAFSPTHWFDVPSATGSITASATAGVIVPLSTVAYRWLRVVYTQTTPGVGSVVSDMFALSY